MALSPLSFNLIAFSFLLLLSGLPDVSSAAIGHHRSSRFTPHNYKDALSKSILFFQGQRSGKLPGNQQMAWRGDSGLSDGSTMDVDLVGGYYDAGDNVKFGFPMAFTTTMLSWSVVEFGGVMKDELNNAKQAIRWATDYLLKATALPDTIFVQVGDANKDHACWERPEDMDTPRTVLKIDKNSPGSEVAAETAAALASASLVFRRSDPNYSKLLIKRAIRVRLLGENPLKMSYMVGYGVRYPQRIHHRASSLPSIAQHPAKIDCSSGFSAIDSESPNPNILVGAVVGGPDQNDGFPDERSDYEQSEPSTYINAPLVGSLAYFAHSFGQI